MPRPRKPAAIKAIQGTDRKDRRCGVEPTIPSQDKYDPPGGLDGLALQAWLDIEPILSESRVLTDADIRALESYCIHYSNFRRAQESVEADGFVVQGATGGLIKNPACTVVKESSQEMRALSGVLGLDPAARTRINVGDPKKKKKGSLRSIRPAPARKTGD